MKEPTEHQLKALKLAAPSGWLRRLPGGYWVGDQTPWRSSSSVPPQEWVGTQTVSACRTRGWLEYDSYSLYRLSDAGRRFVGCDCQAPNAKDGAAGVSETCPVHGKLYSTAPH